METRPGPPHEPPKRPRTWLGAAGVLALIIGALLMVSVSDCASQEEDQAAGAEVTGTLVA